METLYLITMMALACLLGLVTAARISWVHFVHKLCNDRADNIAVSILIGVVAGVLSAIAVYALYKSGGIMYALVGDVLTVPVVGAAWLFIVGVNKAIERILKGLLAKVG